MMANTPVRVVWFLLTMAMVLRADEALGEIVAYFGLNAFPGDNADFTDDSGKGLTGLLGYPFSQPKPTPGPSGKIGDNAVAFDGNGGLAVDDVTGALNILKPPLTLECWARATDFRGGWPSLISYGVPVGLSRLSRGPGGYKLGISPTGHLLFTLYGIVDVDSKVPYPFDGAWHHVAAAYSATDGGVFFYLDGQQVAFVEETRTIGNPGESHHLDIGIQYTGIDRWLGAIDRVRISKAMLQAADLDAEAATVKPLANDSVLYFSFDEEQPPYQGQGTSAPKVAISSAAWVVDHPPYESDGSPAKVTDTPSGETGDLALQFTGAQMAAVQDSHGILNLDSDCTLEAWIKVSLAAKGDLGVVFCYGDAGHGYSLGVNYAQGNTLQVNTLGIAEMPSDTARVQAEVWQHIAVVHKKGVSLTYYVNGQAAGTRSYEQGINLVETNRTLYLGARWDASLPFTGLIDRVRISNSALTAEQFDSDATHMRPTILTVKADSISRPYGSANPALTYSLTGFPAGQDRATVGLTGQPVLSTIADARSLVQRSPYRIDCALGTLAASNLTFKTVHGLLFVTPAPLTVTAAAAAKIYDGTTSAEVTLADDRVPGDVFTSSYAVARFTDKTAGSGKPVSVEGISIDGPAAPNYKLISLAASTIADILPAKLFYTANPVSRLYGTENPELTGTVMGFVAGETMAEATAGALNFSSPATSTSPVGQYSIIGSGLIVPGGNYVLKQATANAQALTITPRPLLLAGTRSYDETAIANAAILTVTNQVTGDQLELSGTATIDGKGVGKHNINSVSGLSIRGAAVSNYTLAGAEGTVVVVPALATVSLEGLAQAYDGQPKSVSAATVPAGLPVRITYDGEPQPPVNPGSYSVVATIVDPNYSGSGQGKLLIGVALQSTSIELDGNTFRVPIATRKGFTYILQATRSLSNPTWIDVYKTVGDGTDHVLQDTQATFRTRFYRVILTAQ